MEVQGSLWSFWLSAGVKHLEHMSVLVLGFGETSRLISRAATQVDAPTCTCVQVNVGFPLLEIDRPQNSLQMLFPVPATCNIGVVQ